MIVQFILNAFVTLHVIIEIQYEWETDALENFHALESLVVEHKSIETERHDLWALPEFHALERIDFFAAFGAKVLVVAVEGLRFKRVLQSHLNTRIDDADSKFVFDWQLHV